MTSIQCDSDVMEIDILRLKTAAAISILRSKPPEISARQYTEQLCTKYAEAQSKWRDQCLQAQEALVHFRQQQVIQNTQLQQASLGSCNPFIMTDANECLLTPPVSTQEEYRDVSASLSTPVITADQALSSSFQFIHSVVCLARAVQTDAEIVCPSSSKEGNTLDSQPPPSPLLDYSQMASLLADTVPVCVRHLKQVITHGDSHTSVHCILKGLDGLLLLVNSDWSEGIGGVYFQHVLLQHLGSLVDDLIHQMFESIPASKEMLTSLSTRRLQHQMLLHLITKLKAPEKYFVLQSIASLCKNMCETVINLAKKGAQENNVTGYLITENYERLGTAIECLQKGVKSLKVRELHTESLQNLKLEVECLLDADLMQRFPLVAHALFRLTSLIEQCLVT